MERHSLPAEHIDSIEVHTFARALRLNNLADPDTLEAAQYSLPFCLAAAAFEGRAGLLPISAGLLHRPDLVDLAGRVSLHVNAELDRMFPARTAARVVVRRSAKRFQADCRHPLGDPANPMDWGALVRKFRSLTKGLMPAAGQEAIIAAVQSLPARGVAQLHDRLAAPLG
jgi:2-methylcitrate dehydratase PrpD